MTALIIAVGCLLLAIALIGLMGRFDRRDREFVVPKGETRLGL